jgi:diacylglycerol kinase (ATP)
VWVRVTLMHNAKAGRSNHSADALVDEIRAAGHDVIACVTRRRELRRALEHDVDVVAVAGGDGTIGGAARVLRGTGIPLVVMPRGTANNIAGAVGAAQERSPGGGSYGVGGASGAEWWSRGAVRPFDVGRAHVDGDTFRFLEAFGCGAFPRVIHQTQEVEPLEGDDGRLRRDLHMFQRRVRESPLKDYRIEIDGEDRSGRYWLVEVMNIGSIGPRLPLAPAADPGDGLIDVVLAGAAERGAIDDAFEALLHGDAPSVKLPLARGRRVRIEGRMRRFHHDGTLVDHPARSITVAIEPGALRMLTPVIP